MNSEVGCSFSNSYFISLTGKTRLGLILSQIAIMISSAVLKNSQFESLPNFVVLPKNDFSPQYESIWASTIAFSVVGIVISLIIYILYLFKIPKRYDFELTMNNFIIISDAILGAALFILGITCAFSEYDSKNLIGVGIYVKLGAFASASAFGFLSAIFYLISFIHHCTQIPNI